MGCGKVILCIIFPPLAVLDCGCGAIILTTILTCAGWVPGEIGRQGEIHKSTRGPGMRPRRHGRSRQSR